MTSDPKTQESPVTPKDGPAKAPEGAKTAELDTKQLDNVTAGRKAGEGQQPFP